ncbi:MAG TPA: hypothetical protein VEP90_23900 [Methylomirabilota bacterium]|nr:hypothetical protein [Methylomirabilota bacterium]
MSQQLDPSSESLKSALNSVETPNIDIVVAGGPSSSELLNNLRRSLIEDITELDHRTNANAISVVMANTVFNGQLASIASEYQALLNRLPTTSGRWMADMYTADFMATQNSATINTTYGQATLPILSAQEKLVGLDSSGKVWIPKTAQINYSYSTGTPQETDWLMDDNSLLALDQRTDTAWWKSKDTSGTVWVRVRLPANLNSNKLANAIMLHPYPVLSFNIVSVEYKNPAGIFTSADLSYLTGYDTVSTQVKNVGNVRLFIPQSQVTEIRIKLSTAQLWGFTKISIQQIEFSATATLIMDFTNYNPPSLSTINVFGKDQNTLSFLTTSINGLTASVQLTQNTQNSSPVITQIEARQ